jgi:hypothetical protein
MKKSEELDELIEVVTVTGGYRVRLGNRIHIVDKQRRCSCLCPNCPAIKRVAAYLKGGGKIAPCATSSAPTTNECRCPICGSAITGSLADKTWTCSADRLHYWQWRADRLKAAHDQLLAQASPYTLLILSAFASDKARANFLAQHRLTYAVEV